MHVMMLMIRWAVLKEPRGEQKGGRLNPKMRHVRTYAHEQSDQHAARVGSSKALCRELFCVAISAAQSLMAASLTKRIESPLEQAPSDQAGWHSTVNAASTAEMRPSAAKAQTLSTILAITRY